MELNLNSGYIFFLLIILLSNLIKINHIDGKI